MDIKPVELPDVEVPPTKPHSVAQSPNIQHPLQLSSNINDHEHPVDQVSKTVRNAPPLRNIITKNESPPSGLAASTFARLTSGLGIRLSPKPPASSSSSVQSNEGTPISTQASNVFESITKGVVGSSKSAVKAVQIKARHIVSQNKRRYQEGEFDLDLTYITENIIAMGFPAGDISSGIFGYIEGFYRNHMEEVIKFFETHHKGKYKVYNLCSERLYDASRFEGKAASFPFDDHNCPPIRLILSFCQSAYSWLKEDIQNVVVIHCKAGMARTGLMICSLLLYLKFFPTAEQAMEYYNQKRCVDGKALVLPSQIRYVRYFERVLTQYKGETPPGRRNTLLDGQTSKNKKLNGIHIPEDFWISAPKKGLVVFALPGERGLAEIAGDFKIYFHDRHGDFYCWLNTTMTENRITLDSTDFDGFDKRKLPSPGLQIEVVMVDYDSTSTPKSKENSASDNRSGGSSSVSSTDQNNRAPADSSHANPSGAHDNDDVFSDSDGEDNNVASSKSKQTDHTASRSETSADAKNLVRGAENLSIRNESRDNVSKNQASDGSGTARNVSSGTGLDSMGASDFKAIAADASVFSFGDDEDFESD
ncbi:hypothetical protein ACFE04_000370 [Oxalis oulophora]